MSYVPPHRRNRDSATPSTPTSGTYQTYTRQDLASHFGCRVQDMHTLCASTHEPDKLSHIIIHLGQHPAYPTLFVHSNLHALQPLSSDGISVGDRDQPDAVPVFNVVPWGNRYEFNSWVRIARIRHLAPRSTELTDMLGRKWKDKERAEDAWKESLVMPWAEVTVEKVLPQPEAPSIGRTEM